MILVQPAGGSLAQDECGHFSDEPQFTFDGSELVSVAAEDIVAAVVQGCSIHASGVSVTGDLALIFATFSQDVDFSLSTFRGRVRFDRSAFNGSADFSGATFEDEAVFASSTMRGEANFTHSTFRDRARPIGIP